MTTRCVHCDEIITRYDGACFWLKREVWTDDRVDLGQSAETCAGTDTPHAPAAIAIASRISYVCPICQATVHPDPQCVIPGPNANVTCIGNGTAHIIVDPDLVLIDVEAAEVR